MKKINLLFLTLAMAFSFNISAQADVGLTSIVSPVDGSTILPLGNSLFVVKMKNFGSAAITGASLGKIVMTVNGTVFREVTITNTQISIAAGADISLQTFSINLDSILKVTSPSTVCLYNVTPGDVDITNDTACGTYTRSTATLKLESQSVVLLNPVPGPGNTVEVGAAIAQLQFVVKNVSSIALPVGTVIPYMVSFDGGTPGAITGTLQAALAVGATTTRTVNFTATAPSTVTAFDLCAWTTLPGVGANDTTCTTYNTLPNTDPKITSFSPANAKCKETVTINGTNFDPTPAGNTVKFRGVAATVLTASATKLTVEVPTGIANTLISVEVTVGGVVKKGEAATTFVYDGCDAAEPEVGMYEINNTFGKVYYANNSLNVVANQAGLKMIQVVNMTGQIIFQEVRDLQENNVEVIDLSTSPSGVYVVNIEGYSTTFVK